MYDIQRLPHSLAPLGGMIAEFDKLAHESDRERLPAALENIKKIADATSKSLPGSPGVISIARSREFQAMLALGLVVAAIADLSPEVIAAVRVRFDGYIEDINQQAAAHEKLVAETAVAKHHAEIEERAHKMDITQIIKEAESDGIELYADDEGRIVVRKGTLPHVVKLMIGARRDSVVAFLRARDSKRQLSEVI